MKKIRIMLLSMVVLAVVGGALAFNAKKFGVLYCTDPIGNPANTLSVTDATWCSIPILTSTKTETPAIDLKYITPAVNGQCVFPVGAKCPARFRTTQPE